MKRFFVLSFSCTFKLCLVSRGSQPQEFTAKYTELYDYANSAQKCKTVIYKYYATIKWPLIYPLLVQSILNILLQRQRQQLSVDLWAYITGTEINYHTVCSLPARMFGL